MHTKVFNEVWIDIVFMYGKKEEMELFIIQQSKKNHANSTNCFFSTAINFCFIHTQIVISRNRCSKKKLSHFVQKGKKSD